MKLSSLFGAINAFSVEFSGDQNHDFQLECNSGASLGKHLFHNEDIFIHSEGQKFSAAEGTLTLVDQKYSDQIEDKLGRFELFLHQWTYGYDSQNPNT